MIGVLAAVAVLAPACYLPPVASPVVDPFRAPACAYCPGNRGLEYRPVPGSAVVAASAGTVTFSGVVAGVRYLVIAQHDGRVATYGYLAAATVGPGAAVRAGAQVGVSTARFYFGLREGQRYIDPMPYLGKKRYRPRLIPTDGSLPRRAPPPIISCASAGRRR
ncbi:MAG TPA: M23 family metallopeptidase [Ilumatobacteraceae bacterium]